MTDVMIEFLRQKAQQASRLARECEELNKHAQASLLFDLAFDIQTQLIDSIHHEEKKSITTREALSDESASQPQQQMLAPARPRYTGNESHPRRCARSTYLQKSSFFNSHKNKINPSMENSIYMPLTHIDGTRVRLITDLGNDLKKGMKGTTYNKNFTIGVQFDDFEKTNGMIAITRKLGSGQFVYVIDQCVIDGQEPFPTFPTPQPESIQHPVSKEHLFTEEEMISAQLAATIKPSLEDQIEYLNDLLEACGDVSETSKYCGFENERERERRIVLAIKENIIAVSLLQSLEK